MPTTCKQSPLSIPLKQVFLAAVVLLASGCATYNEKFGPVAMQMASRDIDGALKELEKDKGPPRDQVLYLLNRAALLRMKSDFEASNAALEEAKPIIERLDAVSVSEQTGALSVNEGMRSYIGEDYERILLRIYKALNYLQLGQPQEARVEALQLDVKLLQLGDTRENATAFAHYLSGIVFEDLGEWDNAMIAYRNAYEIYKGEKKKSGVLPNVLKYDLLRLAQNRGLTDELNRYKAEFKIDHWQDLASLNKQGEFIFIFLDDLAPVKREQAIHAQDPESGRMVRIATPYYVARPEIAKRSIVWADGNTAKSETVLDVQALAMETLARQMPVITARAVARAAVKYKMSKKVSEQNGALGAIVNIANVVSERADTRSWSTLPQNIQIARMPLKPGVYNVDIDIVDANGTVIDTKHYPGVKMSAGQKVYRSFHWVAPANRRNKA